MAGFYPAKAGPFRPITRPSIAPIITVQKGAEKESIFLNLVKRSIILYGKRSITYIEGPGGERRPVEMELKPHNISIEYPRLDVIDPFGLDYKLRVFRAERFRS